jgi:glyoxylase-like metal-dependent hydrolase (beta-lactamase superfamily II)
MAQWFLPLTFALTAAFSPVVAKPAPHVLLPGHIDLETGPDGNTVILDAPKGLIIVDSGRHPQHAEAIIAHAKAVGKPVFAVINTHWHLDHTTGNRDILAAFPQAKIIASNAATGALKGFLADSADRVRERLADPATTESQRRRMERSLAIIGDRAALVPPKPIKQDTMIKLGGRKVDMRLAPNAVTEGDLWLVLPDEKLVIVGDLVVSQFPFFDTGCEDGWAKALQLIDQASWATLIPGHGPAMDRAAFGRWRNAFTAVLDCAQSARPSSDCAAQWERDAAGFFAESERSDVRELAVYYVDEILRAPIEKRMPYCHPK